MIVGICGGSGSGKTTLVRRLSAAFESIRPSVFTLDNYYLPVEEQAVDVNGMINFDLPTALDRERLVADFELLMSGKEVLVREYHFNSPPDKHVLLTVKPSELIIVEGLFVFEYEEIRNKLDYGIFVDVHPEIQLDRRLYRDQETRGYSREAILYQWENHVMPCYQNYLLPYKDQADFIFNNNSSENDNFNLLVAELSQKLELEVKPID